MTHNFRWWDEAKQEFKITQVGKWELTWQGNEKIIQLGSGILDKNHVEIFDGDIIAFEGTLVILSHSKQATVQFVDAGFWVIVNDYSCEALNLINRMTKISVIGNIKQGVLK